MSFNWGEFFIDCPLLYTNFIGNNKDISNVEKIFLLVSQRLVNRQTFYARIESTTKIEALLGSSAGGRVDQSRLVGRLTFVRVELTNFFSVDQIGRLKRKLGI